MRCCGLPGDSFVDDTPDTPDFTILHMLRPATFTNVIHKLLWLVEMSATRCSVLDTRQAEDEKPECCSETTTKTVSQITIFTLENHTSLAVLPTGQRDHRLRDHRY